jgi:riboflavin kinase/FMN adenylyltransferase
MVVLRHLERVGRRFVRPVLTLGNFDGVHRGHRAILRRVVERAAQLQGSPLALTFEPHPVAVLAPQHAPALLNDWRMRIEQIVAAGVENVIVQRFTSAFAAVEAEDFVRRLLVEGLGVSAVIVGHRVRFGHGRRGDAELLQRCGRQLGIEIEIVGPIEVDGCLVSSSTIRRAVAQGDLDRARALLGRSHAVSGRVVHGHQRGRGLGFPTANLSLGRVVLPPDGVYAVRARVDTTWWPGVANLGFAPTFQDQRRSLEVHLLDFDAPLYGRRLDVTFEARLRGEKKFASVQALVEQIRADADQARRLLAEPS